MYLTNSHIALVKCPTFTYDWMKRLLTIHSPFYHLYMGSIVANLDINRDKNMCLRADIESDWKHTKAKDEKDIFRIEYTFNEVYAHTICFFCVYYSVLVSVSLRL